MISGFEVVRASRTPLVNHTPCGEKLPDQVFLNVEVIVPGGSFLVTTASCPTCEEEFFLSVKNTWKSLALLHPERE
jgi:hypothetical protein